MLDKHSAKVKKNYNKNKQRDLIAALFKNVYHKGLFAFRVEDYDTVIVLGVECFHEVHYVVDSDGVH